MTDFPTETNGWDIAAHRERLRGCLPELRNLPGTPHGDDTDIVAMSLPPYYTACPNPDLTDWLEATKPNGYDSREYFDPGPFTTDISVGKSNPFYKAHSYPTKVPHPAIMRFLLHYTQPGDVVLDGFCGSGMTGVAAQACALPPNDLRREIQAEMREAQWGARRAVLADLSPSATFIAAGLNLPVDAEAFDRRSAEILDEFEAEWGWMYKTTDEKGRKQTIDYTIWSEVFTCPSCAGPIVFYDTAFDASTGKVGDTFQCPSCGKELNKDRVERRKISVRTLAGDRIDRIDLRPVAIKVRGVTALKPIDDGDLAVLRRIASSTLPSSVPTLALPIDQMVHGTRLAPKGFTHVHHLWGDRALISLSALWKLASAEEDPLLRHALLFWVEQAMWGLSWMNRYQAIQHGNLGGSQVNRQMTGVYYISSLISECHPRYNLEGTQVARGKRKSLVKMWDASPARLGSVAIATASSTSLGLPDASIDYVFVDPPFGANIPYADLAIVIESWHGLLTDTSEEAVMGTAARFVRTLTEYGALMEQCFTEFNRALSLNPWMGR